MILIGAIGLVAAGAALAVSFGRKRRHERHEVENMFSPDSDDRAWWEERR